MYYRIISVIISKTSKASQICHSLTCFLISWIKPFVQLIFQFVQIIKKQCLLVFYKKVSMFLRTLGKHYSSTACSNLKGAAVMLVAFFQHFICAKGFPPHPMQGNPTG